MYRTANACSSGQSLLRVVVVDNHDSFVFNLVHYLLELNTAVRVLRNDSDENVSGLVINNDAIVVSPGPGRSDQAGLSCALVKAAARRTPVLGVCLGHQCIGEVYGGQTVRSKEPVHGQQTRIVHTGKDLFENLPSPLLVGRYHSLVSDIPEDGPLEVVSRSEKGEVMAVKHRDFPTYGVQFHPESILTRQGHELVENFLALVKRQTESPESTL